MLPSRIRTIVIVSVGVFIVLTGVMTFFVPPELNLFAPKCPIYHLTGLQCPGCGTQRALHHLMHGHFALAFRSNPLPFLLSPLLLLLAYMEYGGGKRRFTSLYRILGSRYTIIALFSLIILYTICRNVW